MVRKHTIHYTAKHEMFATHIPANKRLICGRARFTLWTLVVVIGLVSHVISGAERKPKSAESEPVWTEPAHVLLEFEDAEDEVEEVAEKVLEEEADTDFATRHSSLDDQDEPQVDYSNFINDRRVGHTQLTGARHSAPVIPDEPIYEDFATAGPPPVCAVDCPAFWEHRSAVWGEYLFLRPRGTDIVYASTVDGTLATSVPLADRSVAAFGYDSGFRAGLGWAFDQCSSITANYTWYENNTVDSVGLPGGGGSFLAAETVHPNTLNVAADSLAASAFYDIQLQMADLNYKGLIFGGENAAFNYVVGVKYARLEQDFLATYSILGTTNVDTNVNFDATGPRFGFESEHRVGCGFIGYTRGTVNFLVGTCSADFTQTNVFTGIQARTGLQDSRIVTVPELEVGGGWQSHNGCVRITAGYQIAAWFNLLTTPEYLSTIRVTQNSFQHETRTLTLDGLSGRIEFRF